MYTQQIDRRCEDETHEEEIIRVDDDILYDQDEDTDSVSLTTIPDDSLIVRIMDIIGAMILIILFAPLFIIISVLIKLDSKGPVFFLQKRCGRHGQEFYIYKFRTMVEDAETLKKGLKNGVDGPFKMREDPRVTRVGRFLRRWSLDELPQLFNVLKGEMSLVGPRPLSAEEMTRDAKWRRIRLMVRPGITGLWQVKGRASGRFIDWVRYDIEYVMKRSLLMDLRILLETIVVVLSGKGAC
jgi:lipopolysaccharide/colanic/teichoic acid biosynthesis glycosyltransferase